MIEPMPCPRPPHLQRERTRHGKAVWFVRIGKGPRRRIKAEYGTQEFWDAYHSAVRGEAPRPGAKPKVQSLAWLIDRYRDSGAWAELSQATRRQRENILKKVIASAGNQPFTRITRATISAGIERRRATPAAARHFVETMRGLFQWAVAAQHLENDPTEGVKNPKRKQTDGFAMWPAEWCAAFEERWPLGTRERVWYEVLFCTGLRRSDAVRVGRQNVRNGRGSIRAAKNGETAFFMVSDRLQAALDAGPTGDMTWIVGERGTPLTKESFGNYFREACQAAGVRGSAHGLRKTRATIEAENGASGAKLDALFGWRTGSKTSAIYIRKADRARLAFGPVEEPDENKDARTLQSGAGGGAKSS